MSNDPTSLRDFNGIARLFPLPNLVLFPHVVQPLHIFESRYRALLADSLADDRLIAMALLQPGWEEAYHKRPPIYPVVCLGEVHQEEMLPDGRSNLLLHGLARARLLEELPGPQLYRVARVELLREVAVAPEETERQLRRRLADAIGVSFAGHAAALDQMRQLLRSKLALGTMCDVFAFTLPLAAELKQQLLEETDSEARVRRLLAHLEVGGEPPADPDAGERKWPPDFSAN